MVNIMVCVGSACHMKGSYNILHQLQQILAEKQLSDRVTVKAALCFGKCAQAVSVCVDDDEPVSLDSNSILDFVEKHVMTKLDNSRGGEKI